MKVFFKLRLFVGRFIVLKYFMRFSFFLAVASLAVSAFHAGVCFAEQVRIVKVERSNPFPKARVRVVSPQNGGSFFSFSPEIELEVENYELGVQTLSPRREKIANSAKGQHIHVVVDNKPYKAIYDASKPIRLEGLVLGPHTLVVFPSRSYHESVKSADAVHVVNFNIVSAFGMRSPLELYAPGIIYSRPKGEYKGEDAERIMVDFYLYNTVLSKEGYKVKLSVFEGTEPASGSLVASEVFHEWRPAFVEGLESGLYTFRIELIDPYGGKISGKFGGEDRVVTVVRQARTK